MTKNCIHHILICVLALSVWLTACNRDPHEGERGLTVALDNSRCPDVPVGTVKLCIYGTDGSLVTAYDYADARGVAAALLPLPAGHYTVVVVVNSDAEVTEASTLTALHEWVEAEMSRDEDLLSGMAEVDVAEDGITRVTVSLRQGVFTLPVLRLLLTLPDPKLPDYAPAEKKTRAADDTYIIRCVAELVRAGTDKVVLHRPVTPEPQADGTSFVELAVPEGSYDLRLWTDYAHTDAPLSDTWYQTESLKAVGIVTDPYVANTDAKDAAYHGESDIILPEEGTTISVQLQRPLAKYRIIADDVEAYRKLTEADPQKYPPLEELTVTVQYEGYFPSEFNAGNNKVTDATTGIVFSARLTDTEADGLPLCTDWIMAGGESSVSATLTVSDGNGRQVCRVGNVQIAYRQGCLTTIRGRFLTVGVGSGGIHIDTEWEEIVVPF